MKCVILLAALLMPATAFAASPAPEPAALDTPPQVPLPPSRQAVAHARRIPAPLFESTTVLRADPGAQTGFAPAPVPNLDITPPPPPRKLGPELSGQLFAPHNTDNIDNGYTPGSQFSTGLERHNRPGPSSAFAPTLNLKIPLQ